MHRLRIRTKEKEIDLMVSEGKNLLEVINSLSLNISSPCGGKGICGKCRVKITGDDTKPSGKELELIGSINANKGYRLACYYNVNSDIEIEFEEYGSAAKIMVEGRNNSFGFNPVIYKKNIILKPPQLSDQRSDVERVTEGETCKNIDLDLIRGLADLIRKENFEITKTYYRNNIINIESGNSSSNLYAIAVDIGTTTIASYLININTGVCIDTNAVLNPQNKYGADIVSRINYSELSSKNLREINETIINCINDKIIEHFVKKNNINKNDIYAIAFVGNTTMIHFLMKIPARNIAITPFIPVTTELHELYSKDLGLKINDYAMAIIFPSVSAYIGADTVSAILASGMAEQDDITLMIDLGTNGEIVLGNKNGLYSCSTAAGPAFEGAQIRDGVGAVNGAIDKVQIFPDYIHYSTIGNEKPIGICGSGLVDIAAALLDADVIDETGKMQEQLPEFLKNRCIKIDGINSFIIATPNESASNEPIVITQKDIRELQTAKAAIAAGIKVLIKEAGIETDNISKVYLAGGFGSYINIENAFKIGLIPEKLKGKVESIGNAAGTGAIQSILDSSAVEKVIEISKKINYIELSASMEFMDEYINCMFYGYC